MAPEEETISSANVNLPIIEYRKHFFEAHCALTGTTFVSLLLLQHLPLLLLLRQQVVVSHETSLERV